MFFIEFNIGMEPFSRQHRCTRLELHCILAMVDHRVLPGPIHPDRIERVPAMNGTKIDDPANNATMKVGTNDISRSSPIIIH